MWQRGALAVLCGMAARAFAQAEDVEVTTGRASSSEYAPEGLL